jgi:hypothetical protein
MVRTKALKSTRMKWWTGILRLYDTVCMASAAPSR